MLRKIYNKFVWWRYKAGAGKYSSLLRMNAPLKNSAAGIERCFILATGPSIRTQDLSALQNEFCISVSNFFVHPLFQQLQPEFHIFAGCHPPITEDTMAGWWKDATQFMEGNARTKVFIHAADKALKDKYQVFEGRQVYYYCNGGAYPVDFTLPIPGIQTVVHIAIYLAMYLGIKEIYLLGCDHSWLQHFGKSMHFYEEKQHAFVRNNYSEWSSTKDMGDEFKAYANLWDVYRAIRTDAAATGTRIYNATPGSMLDIFPPKDFSQIVNTSGGE